MDESLQELLALGLVALIVAAELVRRYRKKKSGKVGCEGCKTDPEAENHNEQPLKFYKRR